MRQRPSRVQPKRTAHGRGAGGAREHELPDGETAARLQVVEAVAQPERASLRAQHAA
jgi:hypothetical protein